MTATITKTPEGIALKTPWNKGFLSEFKDTIHYSDRKWDGENKVWQVVEAEAKTAVKIAADYFDIIDGRDLDADDIEDAQILAEVQAIEDNQKYIADNRAAIEAETSGAWSGRRPPLYDRRVKT